MRQLHRLFAAVFALVAVLLVLPAHATPTGFNGFYDYATWTKVGTDGANTDSTIDATQQTLTLWEPDNSNSNGYACYYSGDGCEFNFSHTVAASGNVSFDWAFDWQVDSCCSGFNFYINSTLYNLADGFPGDPYHWTGGNQSGIFSAMVNAGDVITFSAFSADACCGAANTVVTNFSAPADVPEPASVALFGITMAGLSVARRRKKNSAKA